MSLTPSFKRRQRFGEAISRDPTRLFCYVQLALLNRKELHKEARGADDVIDRMVASNPKSGLAYLHRFRYLSEFRPPAPESDLTQAIELEPGDPEVLLAAALTPHGRTTWRRPAATAKRV